MKEENTQLKESGTNNPVPKSRSKHAGTLVRVDNFNESKHLVKPIRASDGQPIEENVDVKGKVIQNIPFEKKASKTIKTLSTAGGPIMEVSDEFASIRGSADNGFFSYNTFGNFIKGPLSITASPHEIRVGGVMTMNPLLSSCFPSTIVTPVPTFIWSLPGAGALAPIAKDVAIMSTLIAALAI